MASPKPKVIKAPVAKSPAPIAKAYTGTKVAQSKAKAVGRAMAAPTARGDYPVSRVRPPAPKGTPTVNAATGFVTGYTPVKPKSTARKAMTR